MKTNQKLLRLSGGHEDEIKPYLGQGVVVDVPL
jgi:hypothetical protein